MAIAENLKERLSVMDRWRRRPHSEDARELARELTAAIEGEVRFDNGSRGLYATDASNYRQVPIGVVVPRTEYDVERTIGICRAHNVPVLARGAGTSLAGQTCNVAVVIDFSKYLNQILEVDPEHRRARVQPGVVLDHLRNAAERYRLTFAPDPSTHAQATLGGMIGNNSCGVHAIMGGKTVDNVESLDILTYDGLRLQVGPTSDMELDHIIRLGGRRGEIYQRLRNLRDRYADQIRTRFGRFPSRVSGYNLDELLPERGFNLARALVGTEGTCVTILEATTRLVSSPRVRHLVVLGYPDIYTAAEDVHAVMDHRPIGLEAIDDRLVRYLSRRQVLAQNIRLLPNGRGWLMVEFGGDTDQEAEEQARRLMNDLGRRSGAPAMRLLKDPAESARVWQIRETALAGTAFVPLQNDSWPGWEDSAVPPEKLPEYLREVRELLRTYGYDGAFFGHFGHGCLHSRIDFDLRTKRGVDTYRAFANDAADLVVKYGGSLSGEHGDGQARGELLQKQYGDELVRAFREFKAIWDPNGKMNPGKIVDPYPLDSNLRLGVDYNPPEIQTHFSYPGDNGSFAHAVLRCVGVGNCRNTDGGVMCPSFQVLREEEHSTRGRARMLFEMLEGNPVKNGWHDDQVREALDLCLSCKGCKSECPTNVDMATYKAEFMSHYYEGRLRPASAYSLGWVHTWARLASMAPAVGNFLTQTPAVGRVLKSIGGIAQERQLPAFAPQTFKDWFQARRGRTMGRREVLLWPDTFMNYYHPEVGQAAVDVLERLGYQVVLPHADVCCGRPLYDFGMLDMAKESLRHSLSELRPLIRKGVPVIGLEPGCLSVFRDEMLNLFPHDEDAQRLAKQTYLFSEFLVSQGQLAKLPRLERKAVVHLHCHHRAVMRTESEERVLKAMGLDFQVLDSGCCGMSGAFGFERDHYAISVQAGERVLLPAVRNSSPDTLVVADGYSCREQIAQLTPRHGLHLAQVVEMAMRDGPGGPPTQPAERRYLEMERRSDRRAMVRSAVRAGVLGFAAVGALYAGRRMTGKG